MDHRAETQAADFQPGPAINWTAAASLVLQVHFGTRLRVILYKDKVPRKTPDITLILFFVRLLAGFLFLFVLHVIADDGL